MFNLTQYKATESRCKPHNSALYRLKCSERIKETYHWAKYVFAQANISESTNTLSSRFRNKWGNLNHDIEFDTETHVGTEIRSDHYDVTELRREMKIYWQTCVCSGRVKTGNEN
jgi:hypothetical protein